MKSAADLIPNNEISTIYFDLDGTLRHNRPSFIEALSAFILQIGLPIEVANSKQAHRWLHYYWAQSPELISDRETFGDDEESFWVNHSRRYLLASGSQPDQSIQLAPDLTQCMRDRYSPDDILAAGVEELLRKLRKNGFRLAVISNRRNPFDEQLEALGIYSYFEYSLAAGDINAWKPDPSIFLHALVQMNVKPEHAVYVGDNYFADVVGADQAGIQPVLIDPEGLFPEAHCTVIETIGELESILSD